MIEGLNLALPTDLWEALRGLLAGDETPPDALARLEERGVIADGNLTEPAKELLRGLTSPAGLVHFYLSEAGKLREGTIFVDAEKVSLLVQSSGEGTILRRIDRGMLPLALLDLLSIGPRRTMRIGTSDTVPEEIVQDLLTRAGDVDDPPHEALARHVRPMWPEIYEALVDGEWRFWTLDAFALAEEPPRLRGMTGALDTSRGLLRLSSEDGETTLTSAMSSDMWIDIVTLVSPAT